jgi:outer membrane biogenesis lipoprotein LolB
MRKLAALILTGLTCILLIGCAATNLETSKEHTHRIKKNMQKDCRNAVEDWDHFWMAEEPSHLTPNDM